jgi:hypothetical protein
MKPTTGTTTMHTLEHCLFVAAEAARQDGNAKLAKEFGELCALSAGYAPEAYEIDATRCIEDEPNTRKLARKYQRIERGLQKRITVTRCAR